MKINRDAEVASDIAPPREGRSVLATIRALHERSIQGKALSGDDRRRLVEHLTMEGYSIPETAAVLGVSERTIERDRRTIRSLNALRSDPRFVTETVGHLVREAEASAGRLKRLARERGAPSAARVDAECAAWRVQRELIATLQRLGYMPMASVRADVHCRLDPADLDALTPSLNDLALELDRLAKLGCGDSVGDGGEERFMNLQQTVKRLALATKVEEVAEQLANEAHP